MSDVCSVDFCRQEFGQSDYSFCSSGYSCVGADVFQGSRYTTDCGTNHCNCCSYYVPPAYCGDSACNGEETCSTCPADCGPCPSSDFCTLNSCKAYGYSSTDKATCYHICSSGYKELGSFTTDQCYLDKCLCCEFTCPDSACNYGETCSTCPADCGVCSVGHIRIQGPNGIIKLNLISAADAIAAGRGTVKVARFNGDINSAAELVPVTDPKASPVRIKTQQGIFSWAELP